MKSRFATLPHTSRTRSLTPKNNRPVTYVSGEQCTTVCAGIWDCGEHLQKWDNFYSGMNIMPAGTSLHRSQKMHQRCRLLRFRRKVLADWFSLRLTERLLLLQKCSPRMGSSI